MPKSLKRYYFIYLIILISLYFLRYWLADRAFKHLIYDEINPNSTLRLYIQNVSISTLSNGGVNLSSGPFLISLTNLTDQEDIIIGQGIRVLSSNFVRVTKGFNNKIVLINPEITPYSKLSDDQKRKFAKTILPLQGVSTNLTTVLGFIRQSSRETFFKLLPPPKSALMSGIVLGGKESLGDLYQSLQKTGTIHIVAASGMNVMLVAQVSFGLLLNFINRRLSYFVILLFIFIYCLLSGGSPAVVRAGLLASFTFLGVAFGRKANSGWLLFLICWLMLMINPYLIFDSGFQLSFCAMAGMIWIKPSLQKFFPKHFLVSATLDTVSAQIATFPVLYFTFGQMQLFSFLPNLMVVPLIPILMMLGFILLIVGLIYLPFAYPIAWLSYPVLTYFVKVIEWWGKVL
jgi:ComEC/Rec2-related protein